MCFIVSPCNTKVKIAEKDIICWKIMFPNPDGHYISAVRCKTYTKHERYNIKFRIKNMNREPFSEINIGFHSFKKKQYHSKWAALVKCIIPKGTRYFENDIHFVSESIIIDPKD